jgi:hypothetical protein
MPPGQLLFFQNKASLYQKMLSKSTAIEVNKSRQAAVTMPEVSEAKIPETEEGQKSGKAETKDRRCCKRRSLGMENISPSGESSGGDGKICDFPEFVRPPDRHILGALHPRPDVQAQVSIL